jgi:3-dehydroquinate synthase
MKTLESCQELINILISRGFKRNHKLVAVGGGITQDVTSFTASILFRGVGWKFFPTTLLAQADSCIGSKTSINFSNTKNLLGSFHPPEQIICCTEFLKTLPTSDIKSGIGEMLHYFIYADSNLLEDITSEYGQLIENPCELMGRYIKESLSIKKNMIQRDEFDKCERRVFNYGHTFGHAIEALSNYKVSHGLAVTIGMDIANYIALKNNIIDEKTYSYFHKYLEKNLISYYIGSDKIEEYCELLMKDKKNTDSDIVCILPYGIKDLRVTKVGDNNKNITIDKLKSDLVDYMEEKCL